MPDWFQNIRTWIFIGVGVAVGITIIAILWWFMRRKAGTDKLAQADLKNQPDFRWAHNDKFFAGVLTRLFQNEGGEISILLVQTTAAVRVEWHPRGLLSTHDQGWIRFTSNRHEVSLPITWEIHYRTRLGQAGKQVFRVAAIGGKPERLE